MANTNEPRRYGIRAPAWVRAEVRRRSASEGIAATARALGISINAVTRTLAGLQQAPGTIDRIVASLSTQQGNQMPAA